MAEIESLSQVDFEKRLNGLTKELVNDASVYRSGRVRALKSRLLPDGREGYYLKIEVDAEGERTQGFSIALLFDAYDLLQFAHALRQMVSPGVEDLILDELRLLNAHIRNGDRSE